MSTTWRVQLHELSPMITGDRDPIPPSPQSGRNHKHSCDYTKDVSSLEQQQSPVTTVTTVRQQGYPSATQSKWPIQATAQAQCETTTTITTTHYHTFLPNPCIYQWIQGTGWQGAWPIITAVTAVEPRVCPPPQHTLGTSPHSINIVLTNCGHGGITAVSLVVIALALDLNADTILFGETHFHHATLGQLNQYNFTMLPCDNPATHPFGGIGYAIST